MDGSMDSAPVPKELQNLLSQRKTLLQPELDEEYPLHYHGRLVRKLFLTASIIMVVGLPFAQSLLNLPLWQSMSAAVVLGLFAGLTTPSKTWAVFADLVISVAGTFYFEYFAIQAYRILHWGIFFTDQLLAVIFIIALYYSTKSFRGRVFEKNT